MRRSIFCLLALALTIASSAALGDVVVDTFGPGSSYIPGSFVAVAFGTPPFEDDLDHAMQFTVEDHSYLVDSYELPLSVFQGHDELEIILMKDEGGYPGQVLESIFVTVPAGDPSIVMVSSESRPTLQREHAYYLGTSARRVDEIETKIRWHSGDYVTGRTAGRRDLGEWEVWQVDGTQAAFRISGSITVQADNLSWGSIKALYRSAP